jgi:hypothetical protein
MRTGRTYTRSFDLETRQHELFGVDLGEGLPRRALVLGVVAFAFWITVLVVLIGAPSPRSLSLYVLPPGLVTVFGSRRSRTIDRRRVMTGWGIAVRYHVAGHAPIVLGGRRPSARGERITPTQRCTSRIERVGAAAPLLAAWAERVADRDREDSVPGAGAPVAWSHRARLYGPDALGTIRDRRGRALGEAGAA